MSREITRRALLAGAGSALGSAAFAGAPAVSLRPVARGERPVPPMPEPDDLVTKAGLGGMVTYTVADRATGEVVDARLPDHLMPPASTLKAVTAQYALKRLGPSFRFGTEVLATGPVVDGRLEGDLVLSGGADPTLDTDRLAALAITLREGGLIEVTGRFLLWPGAVPRGDRIDGDQPEYVGYNPAFGGLNLNFNRVHFEWKRIGDDYDLTMQARGLKASPSTSVARMSVIDRKSPVFEYHPSQDRDRWSVARGALGKDGARWLPVRYPALYCGDVFRTLMRSNGIVLKPAEIVEAPVPGRVLARSESLEMVEVLRRMLKYSTNLTAEASGMTASLANGVPVGSLLGSGSRMAGWAETSFGASQLKFRDHSGLGYGSEISAGDMVRIMRGSGDARPLLKTFSVPTPGDRKGKPLDGVEVLAKTGTLNFVSSLAGFMTAPGGRELVFAIFTADVARRDAIAPEARERPPGSKSWSRRSRGLQRALLARWAGARV
ncbi:MAG: D-alanyl-D-alanine carboxypeptidase/D-alanyl-D-alanine-endopeptidase [Paracoccaceae bacterium]|nr:D-alanyl-D-alanine carboxypeptidase/D-alanyl-D-alanine-endopeptidase [Paracoccaceae bacterium]